MPAIAHATEVITKVIETGFGGRCRAFFGVCRLPK
jgi:hypothetical protein